MKTLTFDIICSLLFGLELGARKDKFVAGFQEMIEGIWSIPIDLPFTRYNQSLKARTRVQNMVKDLIHEKRMELEQKGASPRQDLISCMLSIRNENNEQVISDKEIVHNVILVMVAGYDTSSVLITFIMRLLANEPAVYAAMLQGIHKTLGFEFKTTCSNTMMNLF
jgi:cytochrome P450